MASNAGIAKSVNIVTKNGKKTIAAGETIREGKFLGAAVGKIVASTKSKHAFRVEQGRGKLAKIVCKNKFKHMQEFEKSNVECRNGLFFATRTIRKNAPITIASKL